MTLPRRIDFACGIPLWRRDGTVAAFAMVDAADFEWLSRWRWSLHSEGYACRETSSGGRRETVLLHRQVAGLAFGDPREVDHENRDRLDCRRSNLRVVPAGTNAQNQRSQGGTSRWRGVSWFRPRGCWRVQVRGVTVGYFHDELEAAAAAERARLETMLYAVPDPELAAALREAA